MFLTKWRGTNAEAKDVKYPWPQKPDLKSLKSSDAESVTFDPEDPDEAAPGEADDEKRLEDEENVTPRVIKVKVPKVRKESPEGPIL